VEGTASQESLVEARRGEALVPQLTMSPPPTTGPSTAGGMSSNMEAVGNSLPVSSAKHLAAQRPRIPRVAALIAGLSRPRKSLISAARKGDLLKVSGILYDQAKLDLIDSKSLDPAMYGAAQQKHTQIVRLLLEKGANVNAAGDREGKTALQHASKHGHTQIVELLLEKGADVNLSDILGGTALQQASQEGHEQIVRLLLEKGAEVNIGNKEGETALIWASGNGHTQIVELLLEKGADFNFPDFSFKAALQWASVAGHEQIVRLLLKKGADVNFGGVMCFTALWWASMRGHTQIVKLLLEKGADVNLSDRLGGAALEQASQEGHEQIVRLLLEKGAHVNFGGITGLPALWWASKRGDTQIVELLLEKGADVNLTNSSGETALYRASQEGHEQIVRLLLEKGADVNFGDKLKPFITTALHQALVIQAIERNLQLMREYIVPLPTPTKPTANGLPTSSVVGFSVPASPPPGALSASSSYPHATRAHLLALLAPSTTAAAVAGAMSASSSPPPPPRRVRVRGIVNTGNMCFANAVLQVLVYCEHFWRLFGEHGLGAAGVAPRRADDDVRTPLVDATVQFLKEFAVEGGVAPVGGEGEMGKGKARAARERLDVGDEHDEGEAFVPAYIYEAMKERSGSIRCGWGYSFFPRVKHLSDGVSGDRVDTKKTRKSSSGSSSTRWKRSCLPSSARSPRPMPRTHIKARPCPTAPLKSSRMRRRLWPPKMGGSRLGSGIGRSSRGPCVICYFH
jgi:ankyrin repeat protein